MAKIANSQYPGTVAIKHLPSSNFLSTVITHRPPEINIFHKHDHLKLIPDQREWVSWSRCGAVHCGIPHSKDTCCGYLWPLQSAHDLPLLIRLEDIKILHKHETRKKNYTHSHATKQQKVQHTMLPFTATGGKLSFLRCGVFSRLAVLLISCNSGPTWKRALGQEIWTFFLKAKVTV